MQGGSRRDRVDTPGRSSRLGSATLNNFRRYLLLLHYDGAPYQGWQLQRARPTVQEELERVLWTITGEHRAVTGSGRTDAGVHALGQAAAVDVPAAWSAGELRRSMNALLPAEVWLREVRRVPDDFHPRFHPTARAYEYRLGVAPEAASPFRSRWCWDVSRATIDPERLREAARIIPGRRSFRRFAKAGQPQRGEICEVTEARWTPWDPIGYRFQIEADRYLHRMVRYLVGTMVDISRGRRRIDEMAEMLDDPDTPFRTSPPAPPEGLFLARVEYPPERLGDDPDRDPTTTDPDAECRSSWTQPTP